MSVVNDETYWSVKADADAEAIFERYSYSRSMVCGGCERLVEVDFDERTGEPWSELDPCEDCGAKDWLDA